MVSKRLGPCCIWCPTRTVFGPVLFSLHINDITADIEFERRLFADDCVCYREIKDKEDTLKLQRDKIALCCINFNFLPFI